MTSTPPCDYSKFQPSPAQFLPGKAPSPFFSRGLCLPKIVKSHSKANQSASHTHPFKQNIPHVQIKLQTDKTTPSQGVSTVRYMMQQQKSQPSEINHLTQEDDLIIEKTCKVSEL